MDANIEFQPESPKPRHYWGTQTIVSADGWSDLENGWKQTASDYDKLHEPDLWLTLDLLRPYRLTEGRKLITLFLNKLCRQYNTHCRAHLFSDIQKNSKHRRKFDYHCILTWLEEPVSTHAVKRAWYEFIDMYVFRTSYERQNKRMRFMRQRSIDLQDYKTRVAEARYYHPLRYAHERHEKEIVVVGCAGKKRCRRKGCRYRHLGDDGMK